MDGAVGLVAGEPGALQNGDIKNAQVSYVLRIFANLSVASFAEPGPVGIGLRQPLRALAPVGAEEP